MVASSTRCHEGGNLAQKTPFGVLLVELSTRAIV
jgi:hypothetical protein